MDDSREIEILNRVLDVLSPVAQIDQLTTISAKGKEFPIYGIVLGNSDKSCPTFGLFGGVHGLEKIGSHLVIGFLEYLANQLSWDESIKDLLSQSRIVSIPIVNPSGMYFNTRSNSNGVDIMRNGPNDSPKAPKNLVSGHRLGPWLPWFKGYKADEMEEETRVLIEFVKNEIFPAKVGYSLDVHSGFGQRDRLWFPYSKTADPFPQYGEAIQFKRLMKKHLPYHVYKVEPQSDSYLINGDPWDYLFDLHHQEFGFDRTFIPWTLEMGSWLWVRKNPRQAFSSKGIFNPVIPHRYSRVMRRHRYLLEFFHKAVLYHKNWIAH